MVRCSISGASVLGNVSYLYDLFLKMITVSLETIKIVKALPPLEIHPLDEKGLNTGN